MHKILPFLLFTVCSTFLVKAQYVPTSEEYYKKYRKPIFINTIEISAGASSAVGDWGAAPSLGKSLISPYLGEDGMGAGIGNFISFAMNAGLTYKEDYKNSGYWGIKFGLDAASHGSLSQWEEINSSFDVVSGSIAASLTATIGINYNYNINNIFVIETGVNYLLPTLSSGPELRYYDRSGNKDGDFIIRDPETTDNGWRPGIAFNVGVRFRRIKLYTEYFRQSFNRKMEYVTYEGQSSTEIIEEFNADYTVTNLRFGITYLFNFTSE